MSVSIDSISIFVNCSSLPLTGENVNNERNSASLVGDREIVIARLLHAPPALVWRAFTDPAQIPQWWGPSGFRTTTKHMEVKPGGVWRFVMHGPDGNDYENLITYTEVAEPYRLTYEHGGENDVEPVNHQVTVTLAGVGEKGEQTNLTIRSVFASSQAREFVIREYNAFEGAKQHADRLSEYLDATLGADIPGVDTNDRPFVITRVFQAPLDLVWRVWTQPNHLMQWFGPTGVTMPVCELDLRPGGSFTTPCSRPKGRRCGASGYFAKSCHSSDWSS
jgi:uncharacterized protein YndB with AHSA1/START domain